MGNNIKVSIILPVYNALKYIDKTIESVLNQTYQNYELIIIDDGATDGTGNICQSYKQKYKNITYYRQHNQGTACARNRGINLASGDYITFLDHDDEYMPNYLEELVSLCGDSCDIAKCGVEFTETYAGGKISARNEKFSKKNMTQRQLVEQFYNLPIAFFGVWNALYKLKVIRESGILFPNDMRHGEEDYFFNTAIIPFISSVSFSDKCLYRHYRRLVQSTSAQYHEDRIDAMIKQFKMELEVFEPFFENNKQWNQEKVILYCRKVAGIISYCYSTLENKQFDICRCNLESFREQSGFFTQHELSIFSALRLPFKYRMIYELVKYRKYEMLIRLWNLKNRR